MNIHSSARTCPASRALLVRRVLEDGWSVKEAADAVGLSERRGFVWLRRFREEGPEGLQDRSSRPRSSPTKTSQERVAVVVELRRCRMLGRQIAKRLRMPRSTVARVLFRAGLSKLRDLDPKVPSVRYERERPGELLHVDIKKLGRFSRVGHRITGDRGHMAEARGAGWEFVHVCIDDASRLAYVEVLENEKADSAVSFLRRAVAWFRERGIKVDGVMSDNGSCYVSHRFRDLCLELRIRHLFTRAYRPQTNGKAERFIQTLLREWAYERPYDNSSQRRRRLPNYLRHYNERRPHGSLDGEPPISRIAPIV